MAFMLQTLLLMAAHCAAGGRSGAVETHPAAAARDAAVRAQAPGTRPAPGAVLAAFDNQEAVRAGRETLNRGWIWPNHPWYDGDSDDVALIPLPSESIDWFGWWWAMLDWLRSWNWSFSLFGWDFTVNALQLVTWLLIAIALSVLIWLLVRIYKRREASGQTAAGVDQDGAASRKARIEALPFPVRRNVDDLLQEARRHYENGNFNEAIVYLFSHVLVELDRRQLIRLAKGKTNRQYLREIAALADLKRLVEETMITFEDAFFGHHRIARERFEWCWMQLPQFNQMLEQPAA
jgi:hypothetical protein